jgi:hypothetical protein
MGSGTTNVSILIQQNGDQWTGWVEDAPDLRATADSQEELLDLLGEKIQRTMAALPIADAKAAAPATPAPVPTAPASSAPATSSDPHRTLTAPSVHPRATPPSPAWEPALLAAASNAQRTPAQRPSANPPRQENPLPTAQHLNSLGSARSIPSRSQHAFAQEVRAGQAITLGPPTERDKNDVAKIKWNTPLAQFQVRPQAADSPPGLLAADVALSPTGNKPSFLQWLLGKFTRSKRSSSKSLPAMNGADRVVPRRPNSDSLSRPPALTAPDPVAVRSAHLREE